MFRFYHRYRSLRRKPQPPVLRGDAATFPFAAPRRAAPHVPQLSVVVPVYNHARYLAESVASILSERRYPLELIVVDDGSEDQPELALAPFRNDSRLRLIRQENQGLAAALNTGFAAARGVFLSWSSADNIYERGALAELADFLVANPAVALVYANVSLIDEQGRPCAGSEYRKDNQRRDGSVLALPAAAGTLALVNDNFVNACFLYRRRFAELVGSYDVSKNGYEDYDYWLRLAAFGEIAHIDTERPLYRYRLHEQTLTRRLVVSEFGPVQSATVFSAARKLELADARLRVELSGGAATLSAPLRRALESAGCETGASAGELTSRPTEALPMPVVSVSLGAGAAPSFRLVPSAVPQLMCSSHLRYLAFEHATLAFDGTPSALAAPLLVPALLRRARDGGLGAVTPEHGSATVLAFAPDDRSEAEHADESADSAAASDVFRCLLGFSGITLVLFCRTVAERAFADKLHLSLPSARGLRIIDVTSEATHLASPVREEHYSTAPWQERSLMYALSCCDAILSVKPQAVSASPLTELRIECALAAAAGVPVVAIADWPPASPSELPAAILPDAPHLHLVGSSELERVAELLRAPSSENGALVDMRSLEQYLEQCSPERFGRLVKATFIERLDPLETHENEHFSRFS